MTLREPQPYSYTEEVKLAKKRSLRKKRLTQGTYARPEDIRFARRLERGFRMIGEQ